MAFDEPEDDDYGPGDFESYNHFDKPSVYEPGDIVAINSGGPALNVVDTIAGKPIVVCCWFDKNDQLCSAAIPDACVHYFSEEDD